jgi:ABC-type dipeptide/oligopeptide/nickel transport system permease component
MGRYLLKVSTRILQFFTAVFLLWNLSFVLLNLLPGSPFAEEANLNPVYEKTLKEQYGLGESWAERYRTQFIKFLSFDLGPTSSAQGKTAGELIFRALTVSASVVIWAFVFSLITSFLLTMISYFSGAFGRWIINSSMTVALSLPQIFLVPVAVWYFGFELKIFPIAFLDSAISYVLPVLLLSFRPVFMLYRLFFQAVLRTDQEPYCLNARALGFSKSKIFFRFLVPNSVSLWIQQLGSVMIHFFAGALLVELVFNYEGIGSLLIKALNSRDLVLSLAIIVVIGSLVCFVQLATDMINSCIDPRMDIL